MMSMGQLKLTGGATVHRPAESEFPARQQELPAELSHLTKVNVPNAALRSTTIRGHAYDPDLAQTRTRYVVKLA